MKSIRIIEVNRAAINTALRNANGTAEKHTVTSYSIVEMIAAKYEEKLVALVGAKLRAPGAVVDYVSGGALPECYTYSRIVSHLTLKRTVTGWFLANVCTQTARKESGAEGLILTAKQDADAIVMLRRKYAVASLAQA
jgi:hypothetical protein